MSSPSGSCSRTLTTKTSLSGVLGHTALLRHVTLLPGLGFVVADPATRGRERTWRKSHNALKAIDAKHDADFVLPPVSQS